jgi:hypothetical protein
MFAVHHYLPAVLTKFLELYIFFSVLHCCLYVFTDMKVSEKYSNRITSSDTSYVDNIGSKVEGHKYIDINVIWALFFFPM